MSELSLSGIKLLVCDVDDTLVHALDTSFYSQYGRCVEAAISTYFELDADDSKAVANNFRSRGLGAEQALFSGDITAAIPGASIRQPDHEILHGLMSALDPTGKFADQKATARRLKSLRAKGVSVVALTSSPTELSKKILQAAGYNLDDFDTVIGFERIAPPPKMAQNSKIYEKIARDFNIPIESLLAVGDKPEFDCLPAINDGAKGCVIGGNTTTRDDRLLWYPNIDDLLDDIIKVENNKL